MTSRLHFRVEATATGSRARACRFRTLHGEVQTPLFMPVGTQATVKGLTVEDLEAAGAHVLLANAYHLLLRPGPEVFARFGGIHRFMNWRRSVLTDSGGYQVFSLPNDRVITEDGAVFRSYVDGARIVLSPERSIADAARDRQRHHDGDGRVRAVDVRPRGRGGGDAPHASLGRAQPRRARRRAAGALRHRAGRVLRGSAPRERRAT